jgi:hypothetical protein
MSVPLMGPAACGIASSPDSPQMRHSLAAVLIAVAAAAPAAAQTLNITADPATATIFKLKAQDSSLVALGTGQAKLKLEKNDDNVIVVRLEGFRDVRRNFPKGDSYKDKNFTIALTKRVVQVQVLPYDAQIIVNGDSKGTKSLDLEVEEGKATTVEITKRGFATLKRVYRWDKGGDMPPASEKLELVDRKVLVSAGPAGAQLFDNDTKIGETDAEFTVKRGTCGTVTARKAGFLPKEATYCNKDGLPDPPLNDRLALSGRVVNVSGPPNARIIVNQKFAANGSFPVQVAEGSCVKVRVEQLAFISYEREYCAQPNAPVPPLEDVVSLRQDDSYAASVASDQANVNVTIEVGKYTEDQAWKLLSSIVLSHFDVLENSDSQTGYLRTAWQLKTYGENNDVVIRTRIILKRSNDSPLRYALKIVSERNRFAGVSVKDDENFTPWDRILNTYKDVISEAQSRLK